MSESYNKLVKTLQTIFEMDKADLDFGIYRIMNQKREDINRFLEDDLLPQVKQAFEDYNTEGRGGLQQELTTAIEQAKNFGAPDPENAPAVLAIKAKMASAVDATALENDVFSKLHTFFSRYYDQGDFISQRRYKANTYAIPYEGEEVKLYWANHDQYYIKSSEHLRDYAFLAKEGGGEDAKSVRIKLMEADTEKDNIKAKAGAERRFVLDEECPLSEESGELLIHFNFIPAGKKTQDKLNETAVATILEQEGFDDWLAILKAPMPTEKNKDRTLLARHLNEYTARNTLDYFIHKDLGGFLRRELDFFIKNEVLFLDDIDDAAFSVTEQQLRKIRIIRSIAKKIIRMLAQLENFQKKLWLKKKFVVETNYCITLDRIPFNEKLFEEIFSNEKQIAEWEELFAIDRTELAKDYDGMEWEGFLALPYIKSLMVDTLYYSRVFTDNLLSKFHNIDSESSGELLNTDNFHGLSLLSDKYRARVRCIYIDPPYNTNSAPILYKNEYKDSSWMSLIRDRVALSKNVLSERGVKTVAIDDTELCNLAKILEDQFPDSRHSKVVITHNPKGSITKDFNRVHEYALFVTPENDKNSITRTLEENDVPRKMRRWGENSLRTERPLSFYPIYVKEHRVIRVGEVPSDEFHPSGKNVIKECGEIEVWPIDQNGIERRWNFGLDSIQQNLDRVAAIEESGAIDLFVTYELTVPKTVWTGGDFDAGKNGNSLLIDILGEKRFDFPKSINTVERCIYLATANDKDAIVLDYFAGSGTTAHAVYKLNDSDGGGRKFILIEMGKHFDTVVLPRTKKISYCRNWISGKPEFIDEFGSSAFFKYSRLESYEDVLNNLSFISNEPNKDLLNSNEDLKEDYMLNYWLDFETAGSPSLLNIQQFADPFSYKLNIGSGSVGATKATTVDLVETFNYLIGLTVKTIDVIKGFKLVTGTNPQGDSVLVVWRKIKEQDNSILEVFLDKQGYNPRDTEFDYIYVNGDHTLEDPQSKVKMTEIEFKRLMFDVSDV
jgi:adenine-specific DNA-methyltransferase